MDLTVLHSNELLNLDDTLDLYGEFTDLHEELTGDCACDCWFANSNKDGC